MIALVIITNGIEDDTKKSYFKNPQHCEWVAQELSRDRRYFKGVEHAFCRPEWVQADTPVTNLNVVKKPVEDEEQE